jgi:hypothetical protein
MYCAREVRSRSGNGRQNRNTESDAEENRCQVNGLGPLPGGPHCATGVLRRTSGTLRRTEGGSRPLDVPIRWNVVSIEALKPRGAMGNAMRREIRRPLKHLRAVSDAPGAIHHADSFENRTPDETLVPHRRVSPAPHINSMCRSCGKPKAKSRPRFFLRQNEVFPRRRGGGPRKQRAPKVRGKFSQICHTAVRFAAARAIRG